MSGRLNLSNYLNLPPHFHTSLPAQIASLVRPKLNVDGIGLVISNLWIDQVEERLAETFTGIVDLVLHAARVLFHKEPESAERVEDATKVVDHVHQVWFECVVLRECCQVVRNDPLRGAPAVIGNRVETVGDVSRNKRKVKDVEDEFPSAGRSEDVASLVIRQEQILHQLSGDLIIAHSKRRMVLHSRAEDESTPELNRTLNSH